MGNNMSLIIKNWIIVLEPQVALGNGKLAGKAFYKDKNGDMIVEIIWDNEFVLNERSSLLITSTKNFKGIPTIYSSNRFMEILNNKEYAIAGIWHEIGHIHCGHLYLDISQEEIRQGRFKALMNGEVYHHEDEADAFATEIVGKNRMIQFLQFCKANRRRFNDVNIDIANKEFDARIKNIKKLKL